jgi:anaerobic magnesium-protoporphyrin IX monomethyl ester cyclase
LRSCGRQPGVLAYSVWTGRPPLLPELEPPTGQEADAFSVFGGPHATFFPEMIEEDSLVARVCVGEGEGALLDLVNALERGEDFHALLNWHFRAHHAGVESIV